MNVITGLKDSGVISQFYFNFMLATTYFILLVFWL